MTLQEKIDKLPKRIIFENRKYEIAFVMKSDFVRLICRCYQPIAKEMLFEVYDLVAYKSLSEVVEDVIDRALTIIENREWEK